MNEFKVVNQFFSIPITLEVCSRPSLWSLEVSFQFPNSFPICSNNSSPLPYVSPYGCVFIDSLVPLSLPFAQLSKQKCFCNHSSWEKFFIQSIQFHPSQAQWPSTCRAIVILHLKWKCLSWCIWAPHLPFSHLQSPQDEPHSSQATSIPTASGRKVLQRVGAKAQNSCWMPNLTLLWDFTPLLLLPF